jgi:anti-sigma factor RsiW
MSHLDEGTLHALLDGELDLAEVSEVQKHLGSCVSCGSRLQEVKQVLAEADRLVGVVEVPVGGARQQPPEHKVAPEPARTPPPVRTGREHDMWDEPPVLLVPDPIDANAWRTRWLKGLRWAAVIAVVVGGGKLVSNAFQPSHPMLPERDLTAASPSVPPAVASAEETRRAESTVATRPQSAPPRTRPAARRPAPAPVAQETLQAAEQFTDTTALAAAARDSASTDSLQLAAQQRADSNLEVAAKTTADAPTQPARRDQDVEQDSADDLATRRAAAAALAELDRERIRERANAATAALPPPGAETAAVEARPAPPTLEQRAQIYLRIGLDEAVRQLGGPVHVIEGMTPELIGLTRSQILPGSGSNRPVVRVVYQDARGRLILLDQQQIEAGQAPPNAAGSLRWAIGNVMLYLRGEPSAEVLRSLQARVR